MSKTNRLTNEVIESTLPTGQDQWLSDNDGNRSWGRLMLRVPPHGDRRFYFRYSLNGKRTILALGPYSRRPAAGMLTLAEARKIATQYSALHRDPHTRDVRRHIEKSDHGGDQPFLGTTDPAAPALPPSTSPLSLLALCNAYAASLERRKAQSAANVRNYIKNHVAPTEWAAVPAKEMRPVDITALLRRIVEAGKGTTAQKVRQTLQAAYSMAAKASLNPKAPADMAAFNIEVNPVTPTEKMADLSKPGERSLSRKELGHFWRTITSPERDHSLPIRAIRLTMLLGGQRALQLLRCTTTSVDLENGTVTLHDGKGRRSRPRIHCLPITQAAKVELEWLLQHSKDVGSNFLFAGRSPSQPLSDSPVSRIVSTLSKQLLAQGKFKAPFRYADLRRTIETNMASLSVSKDVRAQIQSHGLGGVQNKHYDKWEYLPQKLEALNLWANFLEECAAAQQSAST